MLTPRTIIDYLCWTCAKTFISHTTYTQSSTPPPMRPGNGSELEIKGGELSWHRTEQLPSSSPNDRFMQKMQNEHLESASLNIMRPAIMFPENPSEFMLNVILLHAVKDSIASLHDETIARMVDMFVLRNLLRPLSKDKPAHVNSRSKSAPNTMPFGIGNSYVELLDSEE